MQMRISFTKYIPPIHKISSDPKAQKCEGKEYIIDETVNYLKREATSLGISLNIEKLHVLLVDILLDLCKSAKI